MVRETRKIHAARALRQADVPAEALLWKILRNRALGGFKFRRQHPIGRYVVDFACVECKVVIESDGESHLIRQEEDAERTKFIEAEGWHVVRFWNTTIYDDPECVKVAIYRACESRQAADRTPLTPTPLPPQPVAASRRTADGGGRGAAAG